MGVLRSAAHRRAESRFLGRFSSSPYTVPLCWVWGPGIAVLWSCQRIDVCVTAFAFFTYLQFIILSPRYGDVIAALQHRRSSQRLAS